MRSWCRICVATVAVATLTACSTVQPYPVPCVDSLPLKPIWLTDRLPVDASHAEIARAMASDLVVAAAHINTLHSIMEACYDR